MAIRYWVGGTGAWDLSSTANWSTASGGSSGASVPNISDDVIFDSSSGAGTVTISPAGAIAIKSLDIQVGSSLGFSTPSPEGMIISGNIFVRSSSVSAQNLSCSVNAGYTSQIDIQYNFFGVLQFGDDLSNNDAFSGSIDPSSTNINSSSMVIEFANFSTLNFDNDTIIFDSMRFDVVGSGTPSGTRRVTFANNCVVTGGNLYFPQSSISGRGLFNVTVNNSIIAGNEIFNDGSIDIQDNCTFKPVSAFYSATANNLIVDSTSNHLRLMQGGGTVNQSIVLRGTSATDRMLVSTVFPTMEQSIWQSQAGIISTTESGQLVVNTANTIYQDIDFWGRYDTDGGGSATLSGTNIGVAKDTQNVTGETPRTLHYLGGSWDSSSSWSLSSGGAGGQTPPLPQDSVIVGSNATISFSEERMLPTISTGGSELTVNSTKNVYFNSLGSTSHIIANSAVPYFALFETEGQIDIDGGTILIVSSGGRGSSLNSTTINNITNSAFDDSAEVFVHTVDNGTLQLVSTVTSITNQSTEVNMCLKQGSASMDMVFTGNSYFKLQGRDYYDGRFIETNNSVNNWAGTVTANTSTHTGSKLEIAGPDGFNSMTLDIIQNDVVITNITDIGSVTRSNTSSEASINISGTLSVGFWDADGLSNLMPLSISGDVNYTGGGALELANLYVINSTVTPSDTWFASNSEDAGGNSGWIFQTTGNGLFFGSNF